jgi:hypothetical protein
MGLFFNVRMEYRESRRPLPKLTHFPYVSAGGHHQSNPRMGNHSAHCLDKSLKWGFIGDSHGENHNASGFTGALWE